jgi:hypothetical protein
LCNACFLSGECPDFGHHVTTLHAR